MADSPRLIEVAFPLKQTSLDSVHEKNVRHGHISTLHIWPARRPLAACRAALIATLLPDPGDDEERQRILEKMGGKLVQKTRRKAGPGGRMEEQVAEETEGGILHWGRESGPDLDWFRQQIRQAYGGRPPKVLDPFAGGGAIPLEAMRLGCEVTAVDINPVAWFILKCTLEYPQRLAGKTWPLPLTPGPSPKIGGGVAAGRGEGQQMTMPLDLATRDGDLAAHVRYWGNWVLERARADLERFYPTLDGKPTVAYLWARTVKCKNCRASVPLLKTRWLCKKDKKRVVLTMQPKADKTGVVFGVQTDVPVAGNTPAQRREHDKRIGGGTMSRSGATCPCCGAIMTMEDIRLEGQAGRLGAVMTAVVVGGKQGKEYRPPVADEIRMAAEAEDELARVYAEVPFGLPDEPLPTKEALGFRVPLYGFDKWRKLFIPRQLLALGVFVRHTHVACETMRHAGYSAEWVEAVAAYLAIVLDRTVNYLSTMCVWEPVASEIKQTFLRFALPITWDFGEANPLSTADRYYSGALSNVDRVLGELLAALRNSVTPSVIAQSATIAQSTTYDSIVTDPPYYDAIPYSDLMDFFYVWLRRTLQDVSPEIDTAFLSPLTPKWDHIKNDGELIDDSSRHGNNAERSKQVYEDGMARAFQACSNSLRDNGRLVVVFANKQPAAWETLVSAIIRSGFVVTATWPIATEMRGGVRNFGRASLGSSIWLVCKKRPEAARPGWDNRVLDEMRQNIPARLRAFWDAGIRGPDFVWAATGPALEAYSQYPVVKKANQPGEVMAVAEFLKHVRRIVVDFVVGRVLSGNGDAEAAAAGLDSVTTYYLLHRHDFGLDDAPAGACILYAISCGLSDHELADHYDLLARSGGQAGQAEAEEEAGEGEETESSEAGTGSAFRLKAWQQRKRPDMGYDPALDSAPARLPLFPDMESQAAPSRMIPLIDQVHRLMHLWKAGDVVRVDEYLDMRGLRHSALFHQLLQALIELAPAGSEERSLLESISNHIAGRGVAAPKLI